jgi:hypothetical protein
LDPDVAARLKERMAETSSSLKEVVNEALRRGLTAPRPSRLPPFRVKPHSLALRPGIDPDKLNQVVDELEVDEFLKGRRE